MTKTNRSNDLVFPGAVGAGWGSCMTRAMYGRVRAVDGDHIPAAVVLTNGRGFMENERTGKKAASAAGKTLGSPSASKSAKAAAGSALAQTKSSDVTSKKVASAAGKTLGSPSASKAAKSAAASALAQRPTGRKSN